MSKIVRAACLAALCAGGAWQARSECTAPAQVPASVGPRVLESANCKPQAPLVVELRELEARPGGEVRLEYSLLPRADIELLPVEFELRGGAEIAEHRAHALRPASRGERLTGEILLRLPADGAESGAAVDVLGRFALPLAESPAGRVAQQSVASFGYPRLERVAEARLVHSAGVPSLDLPAVHRR